MINQDWKFVMFSLRTTGDRHFAVYRQEPNKIKVQVLGVYPKGLEPGHADARAILFEEIHEDNTLYKLMETNTRDRRKKKAELLKHALSNLKEDPNK